MTDPVDETERQAPPESEQAPPESEQLPPDLDEAEEIEAFDDEVQEALEAEDAARAKELVEKLHSADVADLLQRLSTDERRTLVRYIGSDFDAEVLAELDDDVLDEVFDYFKPEELALALAELDIDDAVDVIEELEHEEREELLEALPAEDRTLIKEALSYPEDSAGRLMQRDFVSAPAFWTVGDTIDFLRRGLDFDGSPLPEEFFNIWIVDPRYRLEGWIPVARVLRSPREVKLNDIMHGDVKVIEASMDQEEVAFIFRQRDLVSAPVLDDGGRLVGVITVDDVVDVIDEEAEEDMMLLAGVREDDLYRAAIATTKSRFSWLVVNLGTAILASVVIGLFEGTIEQIVALAVLMPIVASMGGNAGTQTLTVAVRALATKELNMTNAGRVIGKEFLVGAINGLAFAVLTGLVAWLWFDSPAIGTVIGMAMVVNMIVAGLAGTTIPLMLERAGVDPAVASSVFLTTITDVVGFFAFLGLAAWLLL